MNRTVRTKSSKVAERACIGFVVEDYSWLGGINYLRNLLSALALVSSFKHQLVIFVGHDAPADLFKGVDNCIVVKSALLNMQGWRGRFRRAVRRLAGGRDLILSVLLRIHGVAIFSHGGSLPMPGRMKTIAWIPDFQHLHLPQMFDAKEISRRNTVYARDIEQCDAVIVSSKSASQDLLRFCPGHADKAKILRFVPEIAVNDGFLSLENLVRDYRINLPYFFVPNQFWVHKNHAVIVDALALLQEKGVSVNIVLTGNTTDPRNKAHYANLLTHVTQQNLQKSFHVLGVVPYKVMLSLMYHSLAVINPSKFEGWSSTVEEAKVLRKRIILSNIPVHIEQAPGLGTFFDPDDAKALASHISCMATASALSIDHDMGKSDTKASAPEDYAAARLKFAIEYESIVDGLLGTESRRAA
jgi:glycosyltransferase involved in cell wall biosynthesis